jgi:hypothetical protein
MCSYLFYNVTDAELPATCFVLPPAIGAKCTMVDTDVGRFDVEIPVKIDMVIAKAL